MRQSECVCPSCGEKRVNVRPGAGLMPGGALLQVHSCSECDRDYTVGGPTLAETCHDLWSLLGEFDGTQSNYTRVGADSWVKGSETQSGLDQTIAGAVEQCMAGGEA